jgi:aminomethyltransferase
MARHTPLYERHRAMGARMVEFGGFDMPLQYSGIREEHLAVRRRAGLFDISHMGRVRLGGDGAGATVQRLVTNDLQRIEPGRAMYSMMCNEQGGIIDDVVVYRGLGSELVVINAARRDQDVAWMRDHTTGGTVIDDISDQTALLALQGPVAAHMLAPLTDADVAGVDVAVSRTGYTGEDGFELYVWTASQTERLWDALLEAGAPAGLLPAGLGARDTLRLEAGLRLYGQDMDDATDPFSAGLGWTVKLDKGDFIGAAALREIKVRGPQRRFAGLRLEGRAIARHGQRVCVDGRQAGAVTSGTYSFTLGHGIATAYLSPELAEPGTRLTVDIRGTAAPAEVVSLPFYRRSS